MFSKLLNKMHRYTLKLTFQKEKEKGVPPELRTRTKNKPSSPTLPLYAGKVERIVRSREEWKSESKEKHEGPLGGEQKTLWVRGEGAGVGHPANKTKQKGGPPC